jgi:hypothetical protein
MKAINPKTGKPIHIMRTEAQLTKTNRTLLWHNQSLQGSMQRWQRWSLLVTDAASLSTCPNPDLVLLYDTPTDTDVPVWKSWFERSTNSTLCLLTPEWLVALKMNATDQSSLLVTSEIQSRYPYLPNLTLKDTKEAWVLLFAQLMRFHKLVSPTPLVNPATPIFTGEIRNIAKDAAAEKIVPAVYLIQQYYEPSRAQRAREIKEALQKNIECDLIDKIILLNESKCVIPICEKVRQTVIGHRLTYLDVLTYVKSQVPSDTIVVISNSDIYMDSTLRLLYSIDLERKFLALLRYDVPESGEPKLFGPRPDSQDTWIFWSSSIDFPISQEDFNFSFGVPGCDNAITVAMLRKKFGIYNPALSIRTYHLHSSNIRTYNTADVIDKPMFLYIEPTAIQEYNVVTDMNDKVDRTWSPKQPRSFNRPIKYVDAATAETICTMMKRDSHYTYSINASNTFNQGYAELDNKLYKFEGTVFTMPSGVVCTDKNLYVSKHQMWREEWSNVPITVLTNTIHVPSMVAVHFTPPYGASAAKWFLHYLPHALKIRKHTGLRPDFLVPAHPDLQRALSIMKWPEEGNITLTPHLPDCQYVSETVYALTPTSFSDPPAEHIDLLRSMLPPPRKNDTPIAVIVVERDDTQQLTRLFAEEVVKNVFERRDSGSWITHIVDVSMPTEKRLSLLAQADLVIAQNESEWDALDWLWLMKSSATVVEVMLDTKPRGDHIHLAGAANINYVLLGVKREPLSFQRQHALEDINKILNQHLFHEVYKANNPPSTIPTIIMPEKPKGIHEHKGDTFREMVKIWGSRNYVKIQPSPDTPYVWWDAIGETLLYDRPTMRWWTHPSYKLALFGNCYPESPTNADKLWSFWPRSPEAIEEIVNSGATGLLYKERTTESVFIGRVENGVQKEKRTKQDWSKSVELFSMPIDSTANPYKYTQKEYLEALTKSKYGLCLPGYGPKCNREIEYFATGVVPIVTPGVDMKGYAVPPKKGIHYLTADTPDEVRKVIKSTSAAQWQTMSEAGKLYWKQYASAEGLFRLTYGLVTNRN